MEVMLRQPKESSSSSR